MAFLKTVNALFLLILEMIKMIKLLKAVPAVFKIVTCLFPVNLALGELLSFDDFLLLSLRKCPDFHSLIH